MGITNLQTVIVFPCTYGLSIGNFWYETEGLLQVQTGHDNCCTGGCLSKNALFLNDS